MTAGERLRQEGWERGRKDGREEGQRRVLLKLLGLRFGQLSPEVVALVDQAESDVLERWTERILTASSVEEVLQSNA